MSTSDGAIETVREVDPQEWGKALLEEILFRAARDVSAQGRGTQEIKVSLEFWVAPEIATRAITIALTGAIEPVIRTRLPLVF